MRAVLEINGFDIIPYVAEDGIEYSTVKRASRSVVTLDGRDHRTAIKKNSLNVTLLSMSDDQFAFIVDAIDRAEPAIVNYTDKRGGLHTGIEFYVEPPTATAKQTISSITYLSGISLSMEEV